jgi:hypothetical protein
LLDPTTQLWQSTWGDNLAEPGFKEQAEWEFNAFERSDIALFYFPAGVPCQLTLFKLGVAMKQPDKVLAYSPKFSFKKGFVDYYCEQLKLFSTESFTELLQEVYRRVIAINFSRWVDSDGTISGFVETRSVDNELPESSKDKIARSADQDDRG